MAAYQPTTNSAAAIFSEIQRRVANRARVHGLTLVFDRSARDRKENPIFLVTNNVPDLTDEILQSIPPLAYASGR
jgi:hypothetical protein